MYLLENNNTGKNMNNYLMGEFLGTLILVLFGCGTVANSTLKYSKGLDGGWICITAGWAFATIIGILVAQILGSINADINPAVTICKYLLGKYTNIFQVIFQIIAQISGAFCGAIFVWLNYLPHWNLTKDENLKLNVFVTSPAISKISANFISEIIGTFMLVFIIGILSSSNCNINTKFVPYIIGILVWSIGISLGGATGYAINPARDLGPRIAYSILPIGEKKYYKHWTYSWIPIVAPLVGGIMGALAITILNLRR